MVSIFLFLYIYGHFSPKSVNNIQFLEDLNFAFHIITNCYFSSCEVTLFNLDGYTDNLLLNGGFEFGPEFLSNSTEGVLLDSAPTPVLSPLRQWSISGTVKYIDSKHYFVPEGNAAVEFVSGVSTGIQAATTVEAGSKYSLDFTLGDANDSCRGNFLVGAQAGSTAQNFTLQSNGTGSAKNFSLAFKADLTTALIGFVSYTTTQTKDGVFCGPIVDNVVLRASQGMKSKIKWEAFIFLLFLVGIL